MAIIVEKIKEFAPWIYGVCAFIALLYLRVAIVARRDRRYAMFSLEREQALNKTYGAWTAAIAVLVVIGLVYFLSTTVSDAVQPIIEQRETPTPTAVPLSNRPAVSPTLPLPETTPTETPTPRPRATLRPQPTIILTAPPPAVQSPRCADARSVITAPGLNASVSGMVPIYGTATHERFQYYKLEYGPGANPATSQWSYFAEGRKPVQGGPLGTLNAGVLAPGVYSIRLVVVDATGNYVDPPCQTVVVIR